MDIVLTPVEVRVLGSLVEKELTTPEYYPLSLIALVAACNQKSNRDPVMTLTSDDVVMAIETLRGKNLAWQLNTAGGRVPKYEHNLPARLKILSDAAREIEVQNENRSESPDVSGDGNQGNAKTIEFNLVRKEMAVLCVLMLRGPLTVGEIRGCTGRMYAFKDIPDVDACLEKLCNASFVTKLPRSPGTKENRFCHRLSGEPLAAAQPAASVTPVHVVQQIVQPGTVADRILQLEQKVSQLTEEMSGVRQAFEDFKRKFE